MWCIGDRPPSLSSRVERAHTRRAPPAPVHCPVPAWVGLSSLHSPPYPPSLLFLSLIPAFSTSFTSKRISINWGAHCSGWAALVISSSTIVYRIFGGFVSNIHRNKVQKIKLSWQGHGGGGGGGGVIGCYTSIIHNILKS